MNPPAIAPVSENGSPRPFWSVMIPAYKPDLDYLAKTLRSVLAQAPGPDQMQIEVVDDCSPGMDVAALVKSIAGDRVKVTQTPKNLGLAGCWNTCIERSRGEWVHILHQDDLVLPDFYKRFENLFATVQKLTAAFSRCLFIDADGLWTSLDNLESRNAGLLENFDKSIATWQRIQCPTVVVKRSTYESLGGYRTDIAYVLDWEFWCRIAAAGQWGYVPQIGAAYRLHAQSETERLRRSGGTLRDYLAGGRVARAHFSSQLQAETALAFQNSFARYLLHYVGDLCAQKCFKDASRTLDMYRTELMNSRYRRAWLCLRAQVFIASLKAVIGFGFKKSEN
ncbi:MAG: glycosyltransferase [Verrucomicrobiota bacterium]